jgi:hypothetical protein
MHPTPITIGIERTTMVQNASIVPDQKILGLPAVAVNTLGLDSAIEQIVE